MKTIQFLFNLLIGFVSGFSIRIIQLLFMLFYALIAAMAYLLFWVKSELDEVHTFLTEPLFPEDEEKPPFFYPDKSN